MLASAYFVHTEIRKKTTVTWILTLIGFFAGWFMVNIIPQQFPQTTPVLFLSGAVAVVAGLLPGLSGAFTLHILGQYYPMVEAVALWNWGVLIPFGVGMVVGILLFVRVVAWLLRKYHDVTIAVLLGLMIGSIRKIWPWKQAGLEFTSETVFGIILVFIGMTLVFAVHRWVSKKQ
jgi:putative membrane protein